MRLLLVCTIALLAEAAQAQEYDLAVALPGRGLTTSVGGADARRIVTDAAGNMYVAGFFGGVLSFGAISLTSQARDVYVAKLSAAGVWQWAVKAGGLDNETVNDLAIDAAGNLYLTGEFLSPTAQFGTTALTNANPGRLTYDVYVAKLDRDGQWQWAARGGGPGQEFSSGLAVTRLGTVYTTGIYSRPGTTFGATTLSVGPEPLDLYVAQLNPQGQWQWAVRGGGAPGSVDSRDVAVDREGNAFITGAYSESIRFGPFALDNNSAVSTDIFVATITPSGTWRSATRAGGSYSEWSNSIAVDDEGSAYITGGFESTSVAFGAVTITSPTSTGGDSDVYVAKLASNGQWQWAVQAGGSRPDEAHCIAVDPHHNSYITGYYLSQPPRFGAFTLPPAGLEAEIFTAKLSAAGQWDWAVAAGGPEEDRGFGIAMAQEHVYTVGTYRSARATFGPFALPNASFFSGGYVARLLSPTATIQGDTLLCGSGPLTLTATASMPVTSYRWNTGATTPTLVVTLPGTYSVTATFGGGQTSTTTHEVRGFTPTVRILGDSLLCPGGTTALTGVASPGAWYRWSTGASTASITVTQPGTYALTATYSPGCAVTTTYRVRAQSVRITGIVELCDSSGGGSTRLTAVAPGATSFRWSTGATTAVLPVTQPGTYSVSATFPNGCVSTATQVVAVPFVRIQGDSLLCAGRSVTLSAAAPGATAYAWSTGATTASTPITQPGTYTVQAHFAAGCIRTAQLRVQALPALPPFSLGPDTVVCAGQFITLRVPAAVQGPGYKYQWSTGANALTLVVREPGTYSLRVSSACESRTVEQTLAVAPCLTIPNIITPNHDQLNDRFVVKGLAGDNWTLELFNRWGTRVYTTTAYANDWGSDAAAGLYYYHLRQVSTNATYKGWLEVAR